MLNESEHKLLKDWDTLYSKVSPILKDCTPQVSKEGFEVLEMIKHEILHLKKDSKEQPLDKILDEINQVIDFLNQNDLGECADLLRNLTDEVQSLKLKQSLVAIEKMRVPKELIIDSVVPHFLTGVCHIASTCRFFAYYSPPLRQLVQKQLKQKAQVAGKGNHILVLSGERLCHFTDKQRFGQQDDLSRIRESRPLPDGRIPRKIAVGGRFTIILCQDDTLLGFGNNYCGQLGLGHTIEQTKLQPIALPDGKIPSKIAAGERFTIVLCQDGTLFGFGDNHCGQLGFGHNTTQTTPHPITLPDGRIPIQIAAGYNFTLILCRDSSLFGFGYNEFGQLGLSHTSNYITLPKQITIPQGKIPTQMAAGDNFTLVLCQDGSLFGFGDNQHGQLGSGHTFRQKRPERITLPRGKIPIKIAVSQGKSFVLCKDDSLFGFGQSLLSDGINQMTPRQIALPRDRLNEFIFTGDALSFLLPSLCSGDNKVRQLGVKPSGTVSNPQKPSLPKIQKPANANKERNWLYDQINIILDTFEMKGNLINLKLEYGQMKMVFDHDITAKSFLTYCTSFNLTHCHLDGNQVLISNRQEIDFLISRKLKLPLDKVCSQFPNLDQEPPQERCTIC